MSKNILKTASVLAFERKVDPSDALLFSGSWDERATAATWPTIEVREKSVRGTISNRLKAKDQDPPPRLMQPLKMLTCKQLILLL